MLLLSIIIPARDEADNLKKLLPHLSAMSQTIEIIVCDGGSDDDTIAIARSLGARVVCEKGRGVQMNAGAQIAGGAVLWFLHADSLPHPRSAAAIFRALQNPRVVGGNFRVRFDGDTLASRVFENIARVQRRFGIYYGDSGTWLRREVFEELGGYREWPLFEDYDLARRLEEYCRAGERRTIRLWPAIRVSSRRFGSAPWKVLTKWLFLQMLFWAGVAPEKLARMYHD